MSKWQKSHHWAIEWGSNTFGELMASTDYVSIEVRTAEISPSPTRSVDYQNSRFADRNAETEVVVRKKEMKNIE